MHKVLDGKEEPRVDALYWRNIWYMIVGEEES
jgi:hypothetical protein